MAMRPATLLFLLTIAIVIVSISSKRIIRKGKVNTEGKKASVKSKTVKNKSVKQESEEESSEYVYSDEESKKKPSIEKEEVEEEETTEEDTVEESEEGSDGTRSSNEKQNESVDEEGNLSFSDSEEFKGERREDLEGKGIYYSLERIKAFLTKPMYEEDKEVLEILKRFNYTEFQAQEKIEAYKHKPLEAFYVVEGVNPETRRKVAQTLAHRLKGLYLVNQPRVLIGPVPKDEKVKQAYYALSKYAIANKVLISLFNKPVVVERYWVDHASYVMGKVWQKAAKLPSPDSDIYQFPEDLLRPNVTFAIFNTPPPRIGKRPSKTYLLEQRQLLVYKRLKGAKIHIVRFPESAKQLSDKIDMFLLNQGPRKTPVSFEITLAE